MCRLLISNKEEIIHNTEKTTSLTNGADQLHCLHVEEWKYTQIYYSTNLHLQVDQGLQCKTGYSDSDRKENGD